ncbi:MAG: flagellar protein FhlB [Alphaproteobacteria bacterium]|nr:MAG: flagellar protein FhlB [Alphaproteobacteria bacterium]
MESGKTRLPTDESEQNRRKRSKAVALKGDGTLDTPPIVSAVGFGKNAEQILDIAFANELKVRRDADLAEILAAMEVDSPVPLEALEAVAEILTYVYGLNRKMADHDKSVESAETWKP